MKKMLAVAGAMALGVTQSFCAITIPASLDVSPIETIGGTMLVAGATIWVVRKVVSFLR